MALVWTTLADAPAIAYFDSGSLVGHSGKLYARYNRYFTVYDVATNTWTTDVASPPSRGITGGCVVGDTIWYIDRNANNWDAYDIGADVWTGGGLTSLGAGRMSGVPHMCLLNGLIYGYFDGGVFVVFDPATQATTLTSYDEQDGIAHSTSYRGAVTDGQYLYGVDGFRGQWGGIIQPESQYDTGVIERLDPATGVWTHSANPDPQPRNDLAAVFHNGTIYVIGGGSDDDLYPDGYAVPWVSSYDVEADEWTIETPLPVPRGDPTACELNDILYVFSGYSNGETPDPEITLISAPLTVPIDVPPVLTDPDLRQITVAPSSANFFPA